MIKAVTAQAAITPVIGRAVPLFKTLTSAEVKAPTAICIPPNKAEAEPAALAKGAIDKAYELGKVKPCAAKNMLIKTMTGWISRHNATTFYTS